jgi:hypothetical protein
MVVGVLSFFLLRLCLLPYHINFVDSNFKLKWRCLHITRSLVTYNWTSYFMENMLLITMVKYKVKLLRIAKSPHNYLYIENQNENE